MKITRHGVHVYFLTCTTYLTIIKQTFFIDSFIVSEIVGVFNTGYGLRLVGLSLMKCKEHTTGERIGSTNFPAFKSKLPMYWSHFCLSTGKSLLLGKAENLIKNMETCCVTLYTCLKKCRWCYALCLFTQIKHQFS